MTNAPLGFYDSFTEQGLWWIAGQEKDQVGGTLTFSQDQGATLNLLGIFGEITTAANSSNNSDSHKGLVIHGITVNGKRVTLFRPLRTNLQINFLGIPNEIWSSNLLVVGLHLLDADQEQIFHESFVRVSGIESWLEHNPFIQSYDAETRAISITANKMPKTLNTAQLEFGLSCSTSTFSDNTPATRSTLESYSYLAINSTTPRSLHWHFKHAVRLQELASLCCGDYLPLIALELRTAAVSEQGSGESVHLYPRMVHNAPNGHTKRVTPVISGPELIRFNPNAVQLWLEQYDVFEPSINLFFTVIGEREMFVNIRFLLAVQALEVFHRRTSSETVMAPDDFDLFSKSLVEAIRPSCDPRMRDKLTGVYQFANELSLGQRIKSIVQDLTDDFGEAPSGFEKADLRKLVSTRNFYTHFSENLKGEILDGGGMYWASRRILLLLTVLYLQRLGVGAADIAPLLKRHREFSQLWSSPANPQ